MEDKFYVEATTESGTPCTLELTNVRGVATITRIVIRNMN